MSAIEGVSFTAAVLSFPSPSPSDTSSSFQATVIWGDGTTSPGVVLPDPTGGFDVVGTHTYVKATPPGSPNAITALITVPPGQVAPTPFNTANVANAPLIASAPNLNEPVNFSFNAIVANFRVNVPGAVSTASQFTATINWGDGSVPTGSTIVPDGQGGYNVIGTHKYVTAGTFSTQVTITDNNGVDNTAIALGTVRVVPPSVPFLSPLGQLVVASPGVPVAPPTVVGSFTVNASTIPPASSFQAVIDWGDGHTSPGTVAQVGTTSQFNVTGTNTYAVPGNYTVKITVQDQSGDSTLITSNAVVVLPGAAPYAFTGGFSAPADGPFAGVGYSNTNRPAFVGTSAPFATIQLFARRSDIDATLPIGQAIAGGDGKWILGTSGPLANGLYTMTAVVTPPEGQPSAPIPLGNNGQLVIDTNPPGVVRANSVAGKSKVIVVFRDDLSGVNLASVSNPNNYTLGGPRGVTLHPVSAVPLHSGGLPTDPQAVLLTVGGSRRLHRQLVSLRITALGITDNAGNTLASVFNGLIVPASGRASSNFVTKLGARGHSD